MRNAKTIGFISIKGGVGKTTAVANLGYILANEFGKKVLIVDSNLSAPSLALHYGFLKWHHTLTDVLEHKATIKSAIYELYPNLHILPSSMKSIKDLLDPQMLKKHLLSVKPVYDYILLDTTPALNKELLAAMLASDELFVITTPDHATLSCTMHAVQIAKRKRNPIRGIIINKVLGKKYELSLQNIEEQTKTPVVSVLFKDNFIPHSQAETKTIAEFKPKSNTTIQLRKLAAALANEKYQEPRLFKRLNSNFRRSLTREEVNRVMMNNHISLRK